MGRVGSFVAVGIGLIGFGFFYKLEQDIINDSFAKYILSNEYYDMSNWFWEIMPWVVIIVGVFCMVAAGISSRGGVVGQ